LLWAKKALFSFRKNASKFQLRELIIDAPSSLEPFGDGAPLALALARLRMLSEKKTNFLRFLGGIFER